MEIQINHCRCINAKYRWPRDTVYCRLIHLLAMNFNNASLNNSLTCFNAEKFSRSTASRQQINCTVAPVAHATPNAIESSTSAKRFSSRVAFELYIIVLNDYYLIWLHRLSAEQYAKFNYVDIRIVNGCKQYMLFVK